MADFEGLDHILRHNEPLAPLCTIQLGGAARYYVEPTTIDELRAVVVQCGQNHVPIRMLGSGSNVLIPDDGFDGMVIHLTAGAFTSIEVLDKGIRCSGGCKLAHFISTAVREGFSGPERLVGIPGTVGGALHGNATANGGDIGQWTLSAEVLTRGGEILTRSANEMSFGYRTSSLSELVILSATFAFEKEDPVELTKRMQKFWISKKSNCPRATSRCLYLFKDPGGVSASSLIDEANARSVQRPGLRLDPANPNFLIADEGATTKNAVELIHEIHDTVLQKTGTELEVGVEIW